MIQSIITHIQMGIDRSVLILLSFFLKVKLELFLFILFFFFGIRLHSINVINATDFLLQKQDLHR